MFAFAIRTIVNQNQQVARVDKRHVELWQKVNRTDYKHNIWQNLSDKLSGYRPENQQINVNVCYTICSF